MHEVDPSLCVLYYLNDGGMCVMEKKRFYKNKPQNIESISKDRVWRYVLTDHYSGTIYVKYYLTPGEDWKTLFEFLLSAWGKKENRSEPFHGVPELLPADNGSSVTSGIMQNFFERFGVKLITHTPGEPRVKGQAEGANNLVERKFEGLLYMMQPRDINELNDMSHVWMRHFNSIAIHSRHKHPRYGFWQKMLHDSKYPRILPSAEICRQTLHTKPEKRIVKGGKRGLTIQFALNGHGSNHYALSRIRDLRVGMPVEAAFNPYRTPNVDVIIADEKGNQKIFECAPVPDNEAGFVEDAPVWGEEYDSPADSLTDTHRKEMAKQAYGVETEKDVLKARAAKQPAFDGINPMKHLETPLPEYTEHAGTPIDISTPQVNRRVLDIVEVMSALRSDLDRDIRPEENTFISNTYPEGVPEDQMPDLARRLSELHTGKSGLRVAAGT